MDAVLSVAAVLAVGAQDDAAVGPGLAGFLVMFGLALATVLLVRSMVGHLRKVRYGPDPAAPPDDDPDGPDAQDGPDAGSAGRPATDGNRPGA